MQFLLDLFLMFTKLATFSFGGGYVVISSLLQQSEARGWASADQLSDVIALAGMTPGPVGMNIAVAYGYKLASFSGAAVSLLGISIPCAIIVIIVAKFFFKVYLHPFVQGALYTLRATITGIILYAAVNLALKNGILAPTAKTLISGGFTLSLGPVHLFELKSLLIAAASFLLLTRTKVHPFFIILGSGILGLLFFR